METKTICGKTEKQIRKAYFEKKIPELLADIQSNSEISEEEIKELGEFLNEIKKQEERSIDMICEVFDGKVVDENKPPGVDELSKGISDKAWREKADKAITHIQSVLDTIRHNTADRKSFAANFWSDTALKFISYQDILEKDLIYKEQLYRIKLTRIIDDHGVSRREAEERAKITQEYFDYKAIDKLIKRLEEFYTFARRRDDEVNHR